MPLRPFSRHQAWLFPATLEELVPLDHPARFVAAFVDGIDRGHWAELGIKPDGEVLGAPAYHPRALLSIWLYGFMSGISSARKLEAACRDQLPYLWLSGWQTPDHNSLWRFYQEHRQQMRKLLKRTVRTAVRVGLVDLAVQAIDGSKVGGNATRDRTYDEKGLVQLLERTEKVIKELEAQNSEPSEMVPPRLPERLVRAEALRKQVGAALADLRAEEGRELVNLTDGDVGLVKGRQGKIAGYNAQAAVSGLDAGVAGGTGLLITGAEVTNEADDHGQMVAMLEEAERTVGEKAEVSLFDGGYHSGTNLEVCAERGYEVLMPEAQSKALNSPYHKDRFQYNAEMDTYSCPKGQTLHFSNLTKRRDRGEKRIYRSTGAVCRACPAFGECTKQRRQGRSLEIGPHEERLRRHRELMATKESKAAYRRRKELVEPVFGIMKEQQGARRFLLRGLENVRAEWGLLVTAFNLRTLWRVWQRRPLMLQWGEGVLYGAATG